MLRLILSLSNRFTEIKGALGAGAVVISPHKKIVNAKRKAEPVRALLFGLDLCVGVFRRMGGAFLFREVFVCLAEAAIFEYAFKLGMQIAIETLSN